MKKVNKNVWIIVGIIVIIAFIALLFVLKKEKKTEVTSNNSLEINYLIKQGEAIYSKLNGIYFRDDLSFEQENNQNKVYKIDNQNYYKLLDKEYVSAVFTEQGLVSYRNQSGLVIKDDEYYLPVIELKHNDLLNERNFEITSKDDNTVNYEITTSFCTDKERCITTTTKKSKLVLKKSDDNWIIDSFEIDE